MTRSACPAREDSVVPDILAPAAHIGSLTLTSRLLALARDTLLAWILGSSALAALFWAAFRIVGALRRLFGDNALSFGLTPALRRNTEAYGFPHTRLCARYAALAASAVALVPAALCALFPNAALAAFVPGLRSVLSPDFLGSSGYLPAICLLYAPCAAALGVYSALFHSLRRFRRPAGAPVIFNIMLIAAAGCAWLVSPEKAPLLCAWAIPVAGLAQLCYLLAACPRPTGAPQRVPCRIPALFPPMGQGLLAIAAPQLAGIICVALASTIEAGTAAVYFSERFVDLPLGLIGAGISTAMIPALDALHREKRHAEFSDTLIQGIRLGLFLGIPAALGLAAVSPALVQSLLGHGKFTGVNAASLALLGQAWAVPAIILTRCLAAACFTRTSGKKPGRAAVAGCLCSILLAALLLPRLQSFGLGLSLSVGAWLNAALLLRPAGCAFTALIRPMLTNLACAVIACAPAAWLCHISALPAWLALCISLPLAMAVYLGLARALKLPEFFQLKKLVF